MTLVLDRHSKLKYKAGLMIIFAVGMMAGIAAMIHSPQPDAHTIDKILPPVLAVVCMASLVFLYRKPETHHKISVLIPILLAFPLVIPSWVFVFRAFTSPAIALIDSYPPFTAPLFLWITISTIYIPHRHLLKFVGMGWLAGGIPVLVYLLLHPAELGALRGLDLFLAFGPAVLIQSAMLLFYSQLQVLVDRLSAERLQYYSKIIEEQAIRQQAMEQAFTQFHNGPLQSLAVLLREVQQDRVPSPEVFQRLAELNAEIREVGRSLIDSTQTGTPTTDLATSEAVIAGSSLRMGAGTQLDLSLPLHTLLYEVYAVTLNRKLPYFQTVRVKVRNFAPLETAVLGFEVKRKLCLWLEEALCNVGKHAQGATRIQVIGMCREEQYMIKVQDNGIGLNSNQEKQGTQQSHLLAQRLGGRFRRESLPEGGTICELSWPLASGQSLL